MSQYLINTNQLHFRRQNRTFVSMSTGGLNQRDVSPCTMRMITIQVYFQECLESVRLSFEPSACHCWGGRLVRLAVLQEEEEGER